MNYSKNIDTYDFFAYLIPGLICLTTISLAVTQTLGQSIQAQLIWIHSLDTNEFLCYAIVFVASGYLLGHAVATIAALFYDRILVSKIFGYPLFVLLYPHRRAGRKKGTLPFFMRLEL
jgi:hypothetical protein